MAKNNYKKVFLHFLVALTLASACFAHDCGNNCYFCLGKKNCDACYKRKLVHSFVGGGSSCSSSPTPGSDHCLIHGSGQCKRCKPGYGLVYSGGPYGKCIRGTIQNCVNELVYGDDSVCIDCQGGYPADTRDKCVPASQVKSPIGNCIVGSLNVMTGGLFCDKCQGGYTTNTHQCFKTPAALKGCLKSTTDKQKCMVCDMEAGYYMSEEFKCTMSSGSAFMLKRD